MGRYIDKTLILNEIKSHYNIKNNVGFAKFLGIAPTTLSNWYSRNNIDYELLSTVCEDINMNWVLTGKGNMLNEPFFEKLPQIHIEKFCEMCKAKDHIIKIQEKLISRLEKQLDYIGKEADEQKKKTG